MQSLIACKGCFQSKPHHAKSYCRNCYYKFIVRKSPDSNKPKLKEQRGKAQSLKLELTKQCLESLYCSQKMSMGDIAKRHNCSRVYIMKLLKEYNLPIRTKSQARLEAKKQGKNVHFSAINQDFFKQQTPEMAYVLGFIYSDGNLSNQLDFFSISQKDPEILYKIRELMGSEHKLFKQKNQELYMLIIGNRVMINDLIALGLTPNKSLNVKFPVLNENLYSHFIRGYFDGDGTFCLCGKSWRIGFISGSRVFLEGLEDVLNEFVGVSKMPTHIYRSGKAAYQLVYSMRIDVIKLFHFLYDSESLKKGLFLSRKYETFIQRFKAPVINTRGSKIIDKEQVDLLEKIAILGQQITPT